MKKLLKVTVISFALLAVLSCENGKKKEIKPKQEVSGISIDKSSIKLMWTAYKTSEKLPVGGEFKQINILKSGDNTSLESIFNGIEFSIPVSSIFSNNEIRDNKLTELFFGVMENTTLITGIITTIDQNNAIARITMNGVTENLPLNYSIKDGSVSFNGVIDLAKWNALSAVSSLNEACFDLHKGPDGISKTWEDVAIEGSFSMKN